MRRWLLGLVTLALVLAQIAWLPLVRPFGIVPSVVLGWSVLVALDGPVTTALVAAVAAGLSLDVVSGGLFGAWTGTLVLEVLVAALVKQAGIEVGGWLVPLAMVAAGTLLAALLIISGLIGAVGYWPIGGLTVKIVLEILVNLGLVVVLRPVARRCVTPETGV